MDNLKRKQVMSDKDKYKRAAQGDIAYNMMRMWQGAVGIAPVDGLVSPAYVVIKPFSQVDPRYFVYLFRTVTYMNEVDGYSRGIVKDRNRLYWEDFKRMASPFPPFAEQYKISCFLDSINNNVRRFIRNKRNLIQLLKEQKQNVINKAVTRGINPDVTLKPSGLPWLGDIPAHWEISKLKRIARLNPSKSETKITSFAFESTVFLPMENISVDGGINCCEKRRLADVWNGFTYFRRGDVVVAKITPCFENGKGAFLENLETEYGFGTTELIVLRPSNSIDGHFLRLITSTNYFLSLGKQHMTGAAGQQRVTLDFVKNYPIGLPQIGEQRTIIAYIQKKSAEIAEAISRAEREIELMREYRARLISDVVTGKVDVRNIELAPVLEEELLAIEDDVESIDDAEQDDIPETEE